MRLPPRKVRGRPFGPGNPGRPRGSKNKTTLVVEQLAAGQAEQLIEKTVELAMADDVSCLRILLDRLWPPRKGQPVALDIAPIKTSDDVLAVIASLWTAIGEGRLTAEEAAAMSVVAERSLQAVELQDVLRRIADLEKERDRRNARDDAATG
jgi:hypothetical protein